MKRGLDTICGESSLASFGRGCRAGSVWNIWVSRIILGFSSTLSAAPRLLGGRVHVQLRLVAAERAPEQLRDMKRVVQRKVVDPLPREVLAVVHDELPRGQDLRDGLGRRAFVPTDDLLPRHLVSTGNLLFFGPCKVSVAAKRICYIDDLAGLWSDFVDMRSLDGLFAHKVGRLILTGAYET
ncbi:uncharacterized protein BBA_05100 [Beauveria bassiana ARSEF 2860]|uniref:Uncharacterized protein n=1 Tax=Beauveria bassiana (strain ARSEF 2860) TaxID=655819 RepID=J4KNQ8_BEAB2|nr:uncharacterized protein BBA_05100 [Beauveria bassiana ARSEF 2860]EJP66129.1 hypothetical protein BBA_05100 [Beauveria bassiana ARSEF 2860]